MAEGVKERLTPHKDSSKRERASFAVDSRILLRATLLTILLSSA
jgi:hypothetical protein